MHLNLSKKIKNLHIATKQRVATKFMGEYSSVFKGRGIEFADFRQYTPADDASQIDWLHSMKGGKLLVKEYLEERNLMMLFLLDGSSSMLFGSQEKLKHEYAAELVASISAGALEAGDAVGVCIVSNRIKNFTYPRLGLKQLQIILHNLVKDEHYGGDSAFGNALGKVSNMLPRNSILILVSDFIVNGHQWERTIKTAAKKHQVIACIVRDPLDDGLPAGVGEVNVQDPFTGEQMIIDTDKIRDRYAAECKRELDGVKQTLSRNGVQYVQLSTDGDFVKPVMGIFKRRRRR